jgi:hypothetical protein
VASSYWPTPWCELLDYVSKTMMLHTRMIRRFSFLSSVLGGLLLASTGCQPEGAGTVKPPGPRGDDSTLGRPFGNAPVLPKKGEPSTEKAKNEGIETMNPRL